MAQSFFPNSGTIVNDALKIIAATDPEGAITPTTTQRTDALQMLNYLVTAWQAHGMQVWCQKVGTHTLTAGDGELTVGVGGDIAIQRPLSIQQAWLRNTVADPDQDKPIRIVSREEYFRQSTKASSGPPVMMFYDPEYDVPASNSGATQKGKIYLWPVPATDDVTTWDLYFIYSRPIQDFAGLTDSLDFPQEWYDAIVWNLAHRLSFGYEVPSVKRQEIKQVAKDTLELALSWDRENTSVTISPANA
jgi:hypothetical protein